MAYTAPTTRSVGDAVTAADYNIMANDVIALNSAAPSDILTALPGSPIDGQVIYYNADSTNGVVWQLRYRSASSSAYKWEFIGGASLFAAVTTPETRASTAYGDLATVGPSLTTPLAGDYEVTIGAFAISSGTSDVAIMSYDIGATVASDSRSIRAGTYQSNSAQTFRNNGQLASVLYRAKYRNLTGTAQWGDRYMTMKPIRVG